MPSDLQDGRTIDQSGRDPALANLSPGLAEVLGLLTSGTFGPTGTTSLQSANLSQFLENRLRVVTQTLGSTLYKLTWKPWVTPLGVSRFRLRGSVPRTSENGRIGWPTPCAQDPTGGGSLKVGMKALGIPRSSGSKIQLQLRDAVKLAGWVTPTTRDHKDTGADIKPRADGTERFDQLPRQANLAGWPTPRSVEAGHSTGNPDRAFNNNKSRIEDAVFLANGPARLTDYGALLTGFYAGMESGGQLNPTHSRWLMGYPAEWDACAPTEMPSTRTKRRNS